MFFFILQLLFFKNQALKIKTANNLMIYIFLKFGQLKPKRSFIIETKTAKDQHSQRPNVIAPAILSL